MGQIDGEICGSLNTERLGNLKMAAQNGELAARFGSVARGFRTPILPGIIRGVFRRILVSRGRVAGRNLSQRHVGRYDSAARKQAQRDQRRNYVCGHDGFRGITVTTDNRRRAIVVPTPGWRGILDNKGA